MILEDIQEARNIIEWVQEYIDGTSHVAGVYISGLNAVSELLGEIQQLLEGGKNMVNMISRPEALRKCIVVFEALKRVSSKGNAGLEPERGAEKEFWADYDILNVLRDMLRDLESGQGLKAEEKSWQAEGRKGPPERLVL